MEREEIKVSVERHVDDMFVMGDDSECNTLAVDLNLHFPTKNLGQLVLYLGCQYRHGLEKGVLKLTQTAYDQEIIKTFSIDKTAGTPAYVSSLFKVEEGKDYTGIYRQAVGSLMRLSNKTRREIADAVRAGSRHNENPTPEDWRLVLRVLDYLNSAVYLGIMYVRDSSEEWLA
ncbi:unnamed protein product [Sphacelaria rigidula]